VRQAREQAQRLGRTVEFRIGDLGATGLDPGSAAAALCVDAIQFAPQQDAAYRELRRVLAPGGRAVLTCWEPASFSHVEVQERPGWRAAERAMWEEAAALSPGDDPALQSFHDEGARSLDTFTLLRRVMGTATAPSPAPARTNGERRLCR
jgi:SAM-dependent methyltransferase